MSVPFQPANRILRKLQPDDIQSMLPLMELVELDIKASIYEPNHPIEYAYFPESGVISIVTPLEDGSSVEVAVIGNEGMVGLPVILQANSSPTRAFCQVSGKSWRIKAECLKQQMDRSANFTRLMLRYTQTVFDLIAQTSACNRLHTIEERCARWLLLLHDRASNGSDTFFLTQEFLAQMLGVRRSGVNLAAGMLQKANLINYVRGKITILDRTGLEEACCECYGVVCKALDALDERESVGRIR